MKKSTVLSAAALAAGVSFSVAVMATDANAMMGDTEGKEKCYGIVKAGHNDCGANGHSCMGMAEVDGDPNEWVMMPEGLCDKLVGASTEPGGDDMMMDDEDMMDMEG